jgi:hypothetical protein
LIEVGPQPASSQTVAVLPSDAIRRHLRPIQRTADESGTFRVEGLLLEANFLGAGADRERGGERR